MFSAWAFALILGASFTFMISGIERQRDVQPVSSSRHNFLIELLEGKCKTEKYLTKEEQTAARQLRRWKEKYHISVENILNPVTNLKEKRILLDGKILLTKPETSYTTKKAMEESKGSGARKLNHRLKNVFAGVNRNIVLKECKNLPEKQLINPVFDNKAPLRPIRASYVQHRHQIDLVNMTKYEVHQDGKNYRYVLQNVSVIDLFSRYLWLRPIQSKNSKEISEALREIYRNEGPPEIIQTDNGGEFKGAVKKLMSDLGTKIIRGRPYYPQSQGKIESSHKAWKRKMAYDLRNEKASWPQLVTKYAMLRNEEVHDSIKMTPFEVYHGRPSRRQTDPANIGKRGQDDHLSGHLEKFKNIRQRAKTNSLNAATRMIRKHLRKCPPSIYFVGESVLVLKKSTRGKLRKHVTAFGKVVKTDYANHRYKISLDNSKPQWYSVENVASTTRARDLGRRNARLRLRVKHICQCDDSKCKLNSDLYCSNSMAKRCCKLSKTHCDITEHNKLDIRKFEMGDATITNLFNKFKDIHHELKDDNASDNLVRNALMYNLIPEGDIPKDGNCMFHAIAQSLSALEGRVYDQSEIRMAVAEWLFQHNSLENGEHLSNFVPNTNWIDYLRGILENQWGDHLCLLAASNVFNVRISVVSSQHENIHEFEPRSHLPHRNIYLGHEFELHYIRLSSIQPLDQNSGTITEQRHHPTSSPSHQSPTSSPSHRFPTSSPSHHSPSHQSPTSSPSHVFSASSPSHYSPSHHLPTKSPSHHSQSHHSPTSSPSHLFSISSQSHHSPSHHLPNTSPSHSPTSPLEERTYTGLFSFQTPARKTYNLRLIRKPPACFTPSAYCAKKKKTLDKSEPINTSSDFELLPDDVLVTILKYVIFNNIFMITVLRLVSRRIADIVENMAFSMPRIYLSEGLVLNMNENIQSTVTKGSRCSVSIRKISRTAGRNSGVIIQLRELLKAAYKNWFNAFITLERLDESLPGWFAVVDINFKH